MRDFKNTMDWMDYTIWALIALLVTMAWRLSR